VEEEGKKKIEEKWQGQGRVGGVQVNVGEEVPCLASPCLTLSCLDFVRHVCSMASHGIACLCVVWAMCADLGCSSLQRRGRRPKQEIQKQRRKAER
jgi:hypothetical protein